MLPLLKDLIWLLAVCGDGLRGWGGGTLAGEVKLYRH